MTELTERIGSARIVLVLSGGNALGSYQAGVYQALHEHGIASEWIVGTSAGAINGALIAGNVPDQRIAALTDFWRPGSSAIDPPWWLSANETLRRTAAMVETIGSGRAGAFDAIGPFGSWWRHDPTAAAPSLFDAQPLAGTLPRLTDFDRLNGIESPRFTVGAVDLDSGDDVFFDSAQEGVTVDHVRASAALLPNFAPVTIGNRAFVDGGVSANLPLDPVLGDATTRPTLCIAVDLLPLAAARPRTLGEAAGRAQDLIFAAQSRRSVARWQEAYEHDPRFARSSTLLLRLTYADQDREVAGKGMDFSPSSTQYRWRAGHRDACVLLDDIRAGAVEIGRRGLMVR